MSIALESRNAEADAAQTTGRLPDFVIIGAAKSGTTTLFQYLSRHPRVCAPNEKEPDFFADKFHRGWEWYTSNFEDARPGQVCGEASTVYTWWQEYPTCAARIGKYLPNAKLIYIMRHPVERTYSDYGEQLRTARALGITRPELSTFENFIQSYEHLVRTGEYIRFIEEYRKYFADQAFLFLFLDELKRDPVGVLKKTCRHLGINDNIDLLDTGQIRANQAKSHYQWQVRLKMTERLRAIPGLQALLGAAIPNSWRERAYSLLERTRYADALRERLVPPPMNPDTRELLLERFREPNRRLEQYLGCDLSHWNR